MFRWFFFLSYFAQNQRCDLEIHKKIPYLTIFGSKTHILHTGALFSYFLVMFLYPYLGKKLTGTCLNTFLNIKVGFSWIGDALTAPRIANFAVFKSQNTHFVPCSTVIMLSGDFSYPSLGKKLAGACGNTFWTSTLYFLGWVMP